MSQVKGTKMTKEKHELYPFDLAQFSAPNTLGGCEIIDVSSPQSLYHKFLVSLIRFQEQAVAYQARGVA